jgi:hypothetical protein
MVACATSPALELGLHGALELGGVPERGKVVRHGAARVGRMDFPIRRERRYRPRIGKEAI